MDKGLDPMVTVKTRSGAGNQPGNQSGGQDSGQGGGQSTGEAKNRGLLAPDETRVQGSDLSGRRWNGPKIGPKPEPKPEPKTGAWSSLLGKTFQHEPDERNPNQTAREMEELARRPELSPSGHLEPALLQPI